MAPTATNRLMTEAERALLAEPPLKLFGWWTGLVSSGCLFVLTFLVMALLAVVLPFEAVVPAAVGTAALASIAAYVWIQRKARRGLSRQRAVTARAAAAGSVQSTVYTIRDAVAVEEQEDEGLSYYLLLDDGSTLFLSGQYLYESADNGFPWECFEVVRVVPDGWVLHIVPLGPPLAPSWTRGPFSERECRSGAVPADGAIDRRDFNALKAPAV